jgi:hypothetical protein
MALTGTVCAVCGIGCELVGPVYLFVVGPITQEWLIGLLSSNRLLFSLDKIYLHTNFQTYSYCI